MDKTQAIRIATAYNKWRRGGEDIEMLTPFDIGIALDVLIEAASQKNTIAEAIRAKATSFPLTYLGDVECYIVEGFFGPYGGASARHVYDFATFLHSTDDDLERTTARTFLLFVAEAIES